MPFFNPASMGVIRASNKLLDLKNLCFDLRGICEELLGTGALYENFDTNHMEPCPSFTSTLFDVICAKRGYDLC